MVMTWFRQGVSLTIFGSSAAHRLRGRGNTYTAPRDLVDRFNAGHVLRTAEVSEFFSDALRLGSSEPHPQTDFGLTESAAR